MFKAWILPAAIGGSDGRLVTLYNPLRPSTTTLNSSYQEDSVVMGWLPTTTESLWCSALLMSGEKGASARPTLCHTRAEDDVGESVDERAEQGLPSRCQIAPGELLPPGHRTRAYAARQPRFCHVHCTAPLPTGQLQARPVHLSSSRSNSFRRRVGHLSTKTIQDASRLQEKHF